VAAQKYVFISYVGEDSETVDRLCGYLIAAGVKVWLDKNRIAPGVRWRQAIRRAISEGAFFIACFSKVYNDRSKTYMNEELILAIEELRQRPTDQSWFIPVKLDECEIPDRDIGAGETLRDLQYVELDEVNWNGGIKRILEVVEADVVMVEDWFYPPQACNYLADAGLHTRGYNYQSGNVYGALSDCQELGSEFPLANNIAYYVTGSENKVDELKLVLNVNMPNKSGEAHNTLLRYSEILYQKALDKTLLSYIKTSIVEGKAGQWHSHNVTVELRRDDWDTGKGYSLTFTIREKFQPIVDVCQLVKKTVDEVNQILGAMPVQVETLGTEGERLTYYRDDVSEITVFFFKDKSYGVNLYFKTPCTSPISAFRDIGLRVVSTELKRPDARTPDFDGRDWSGEERGVYFKEAWAHYDRRGWVSAGASVLFDW